MKSKLILSFLLVLTVGVNAQQKVCIAFYNQENLFDTIDDPHKNDNEFLPTARNQWNSEKYFNKLDHMAQVIASMNESKGPDILGMCEVENLAVVHDLMQQKRLKSLKYAAVHFESPDERSIDNALVYKTSKFSLITAYPYPVIIDTLPRFKTRDILLVKLQAKNKATLILLVNHFPSRLGGQETSEFKRFRAAAVLKHIFDSIHTADPNQAVIAMGDFNDEPNDPAMDSILGAGPDSGFAFFNPMYALYQSGIGSHLYRKHWSMLDQFVLNPVLHSDKGKINYQHGSATVFQQPWMLETDEKYKGAPKRTFAGAKYLNGYSDHFPVYLYLNSR